MVLLRLVLYGECDEPEFYQFLRGQGVFLQLLDFYRWICLTRNWHSGLTGVSHFLVRWLIRYVLWCTVCSSHEWGRKDAFSYGLPIEIIFRLHTHTHTHTFKNNLWGLFFIIMYDLSFPVSSCIIFFNREHKAEKLTKELEPYAQQGTKRAF